MEQSKKILLSVGILTFNSEKTITRALSSIKDFDDVIICDGGSTDKTLQIAQSFGARVIQQDAKYKNQDGRLRDFSGVRNQTLEAAKHGWFFFLDSDEYLDQNIVSEIAEIVSRNERIAYWVPRKYVLNDKVIDCASTYPNKQMRLFHRERAKYFIKEVHERIALKEGTAVKVLTNPMYVPLTESAKEMREKWKRYIRIEVNRREWFGILSWIKWSSKELAIGGLYIIRTMRNYVFCKGTKMPLKFELSRVWHQVYIVIAMMKKISLKKL